MRENHVAVEVLEVTAACPEDKCKGTMISTGESSEDSEGFLHMCNLCGAVRNLADEYPLVRFEPARSKANPDANRLAIIILYAIVAGAIGVAVMSMFI